MKVLLINGSPNEKGCTYTALEEVAGTLESEGISTGVLWLGRGDIPGCKDCRYCKMKKRCVIEDVVNETVARIDGFDGFVFGSPVYFSGPSGQMCSFMDRLFYSAGYKMAGKVAASIVSCRRGGASEAFARMNQYYLMSNMVVPGSQYWNQVHGNAPDEVLKDLEGLQTMRTLARNMAWLIKCIDVGKASGIIPPDAEERVRTNFIRD